MACPLFEPTRPYDDPQWLTPPRLPLGRLCAGVCRAGKEPFEPDLAALRTRCNRGYARSTCPQFPAGYEIDAVRLSLEADHGDQLDLILVLECEHLPVRHSRIHFDTRTGLISGDIEGDTVRAHAEMFAANYLRRRIPD